MSIDHSYSPDARRGNSFRRTAAMSLAGIVVMMALGGCATRAPLDVAAPEPLSYTVQPGDRLGDIARELTGNLQSWKAIADANGIDDPRSLRAGTVIVIPAALRLSADTGTAAVTSAGLAADTSPSPSSASSREIETSDRPRATTVALATRRNTSSKDDTRTPPVELSAVDVNRSFELSPLKDAASTPSSTTRDASNTVGTQQLRVLGSYFPKGIYAQPASYSELLMRVAPGTVFELEERVGDWYRVVTDQGIGYIRDIDGRIVESTGSASVDAVRG